ncbi:hypothetical protein Gotri_004222, partial [Gossypium trilobum]|nr:hypothetical protein [Gossypium trilobum]
MRLWEEDPPDNENKESNSSNNARIEVYTNDDIDLRDDDVEREIVDRIPSIQLLDRVHNFLEESISKTVFVEGSWVVFDQYLTVQPWLSLFSTSNMFPNSIVASIHLPRLIVQMYKKSILKAICVSIGRLPFIFSIAASLLPLFFLIITIPVKPPPLPLPP